MGTSVTHSDKITSVSILEKVKRDFERMPQRSGTKLVSLLRSHTRGISKRGILTDDGTPG